MKKYFIAMGIVFAIICGVIIGAVSAHSEAITEYEPTKVEIAEDTIETNKILIYVCVINITILIYHIKTI